MFEIRNSVVVLVYIHAYKQSIALYRDRTYDLTVNSRLLYH